MNVHHRDENRRAVRRQALGHPMLRIGVLLLLALGALSLYRYSSDARGYGALAASSAVVEGEITGRHEDDPRAAGYWIDYRFRVGEGGAWVSGSSAVEQALYDRAAAGPVMIAYWPENPLYSRLLDAALPQADGRLLLIGLLALSMGAALIWHAWRPGG